MSHNHTAKRHKWENGELKIQEFAFFTLEAALAFAHGNFEGAIKIYDHGGTLVFSTGQDDKELYA